MLSECPLFWLAEKKHKTKKNKKTGEDGAAVRGGGGCK